ARTAGFADARQSPPHRPFLATAGPLLDPDGSGVRRMNIAPRTESLRSLRDNRMGWRSALAELVDNALDAASDHITLEWRAPAMFRCQDNGYAVPPTPAGMECLFQQGAHVPHAGVKRRSGEYGVGFKHAMGWMWGILNIRSCRDGLEGDVEMDWDDV